MKSLAVWTGGALLTLVAGTALGQDESTNRVAVETAWNVFVEEDPQECWSVSAPVETLNTQGGEEVDVLRGDIGMYVTYRPGSDVEGEVSFTGGYPFAEGSTVEVDVGGTEYEFFTEGEWAWPASAEADAEVIAALRQGSEAIVTAGSSRGTTTQDTFSLYGFTAALDEVQSRCE